MPKRTGGSGGSWIALTFLIFWCTLYGELPAGNGDGISGRKLRNARRLRGPGRRGDWVSSRLIMRAGGLILPDVICCQAQTRIPLVDREGVLFRDVKEQGQRGRVPRSNQLYIYVRKFQEGHSRLWCHLAWTTRCCGWPPLEARFSTFGNKLRVVILEAWRVAKLWAALAASEGEGGPGEEAGGWRWRPDREGRLGRGLAAENHLARSALAKCQCHPATPPLCPIIGLIPNGIKLSSKCLRQ